MIHRINVFLLSCIIAIAPIFFINQAFAMFGGWSVGTPNYQGAGSFYYPATKTTMLNGKPSNKTSGFTVPVSPARVAKVLAGGVGAVALAEAVTMLLGAGVDWVLDPANSRVLYTDPENPIPPTDPSVQYIYESSSAIGPVRQFSSLNLLCSYIKSVRNFSASDTCSLDTNQDGTVSGRVVVVGSNGVSYGQFGSRVANPAYNPAADKPEENQKSIPLTTVAAQVISNADSHSNAGQRQAAVTVLQTAANDIVNEAENDATKARPFVNQMERGASTSTSETATGSATTRPSENTGENTPAAPPADISLEFPVFCGWAPVVCEAAQEAIIFPQTVAEWWATTKDWAKAEDVAKGEQLQIKEELDTDILNKIDSVQFNSSAYCPDDISIPVSFLGLGSTSLSISYTPLCAMAEQARPGVILMGWLMGAYIITGRNMREGD